ncbi:MAG TPA: glycoside hydrolase family 28 protein [Bacteroidetes bacterium]|nr:glycoside hydrolase family 28 protein [Bacteroidota bacterium]
MKFLLFTCFIVIGQASLYAIDYNILDFGATSDGKTLNTVKIQLAIDSAHKNGGGRVVVPEGRFLTGSILLKSGVELHLLKDAVLLGSTLPVNYINIGYWKALVLASGQENISITGKGEIDGQGRQLALHLDSLFYIGEIDSAQYNLIEMRPKYYLRPLIIQFVECKNIKVTGITLKNSACWVQTYERCKNLIIDSIRVDSDAYWNNDGIDIADCINVRITNCIINSSDDGICIKSHFKDYPCDSIYIANCEVRSSASAIKLGTKSLSGFKNVIIENIKVYDTFRSAIAIESVDGGIIENVLVNNVTAVNTGNAIFIRLGKRVAKEPAGILKNVTLKNIKVEVAFGRPDEAYEIRGPALPYFHNTFPSSITGIPGHSVENVSLENIEIIYPGRGNNGLANMPLSRLDDVPEKEADYPEFSMFGELPAWGLYVRHMDGLTMKNIKFSIKAPDYRPALVFDDVQNLDIKSMIIQGEIKDKHIVLHKTKNVKIDNDKVVLRM